MSPAFVTNGLVAILIALLAFDAVSRGASALSRSGKNARLPMAVGAMLDIAVAALLWWLTRRIGAPIAIGLAVAVLCLAAGWRMIAEPEDLGGEERGESPDNTHPDGRLGLPADPRFATLRDEANASRHYAAPIEWWWIALTAAVFFVIHFGRMPTRDSWLGILSPVVATAGDILMTFLAAIVIFLPARLLWRRMTRWLERIVWRNEIGADARTELNRGCRLAGAKMGRSEVQFCDAD